MADTPLNLAYDRTGDDVTLTWDAPRAPSGTLNNFIVRRDGQTVATVPATATQSAQPNIMFLGDSMTYGSIGTTGTGTGGWRRRVLPALTADGVQFQTVGPVSDDASLTTKLPFNDLYDHHAGILGASIDQLSNGTPENITTWQQRYSPDLICIAAGTYDIFAGITPTVTRDRMTALLSKIYTNQPNVVVIVCTVVPPLADSGNSTKAATTQINRFFVDSVNTYAGQGQICYYNDVWQGFPSVAANYADNLHPNDTGYAYPVTNIKNAIEEALGR
jgi:lysophospholipase L1-like esterase